MTNITGIFEEVYVPTKAMLIYHPLSEQDKNVYVEAYDINENGNPVNAHPLGIEEAAALAKSLNNTPQMQRRFLQPEGLLPENLLYINPSGEGVAIWYTPPQKIQLFFVRELGIPCGKAGVPSLVWKATKNSLQIYALKKSAKPTLKTTLYYAPFFNIYKTGQVCMGTVDIEINNYTSLEDFMWGWQEYFFNSYFSHLLDEYCPVSVNIVELWQQQVNTDSLFPVDTLIKSGKIIKDLLQ